MYALKQAHLVRDKTGADVFEFYMDIRAFGKGYEEFYERVQEEGVHFVRGKGAEVTVRTTASSSSRARTPTWAASCSVAVDMVILGTGFTPQPDAAKVGHLFGLGRGERGLFRRGSSQAAPGGDQHRRACSWRGPAQGPRDVPDTVAHANAAAAEALVLLNKGEVTISPAEPRSAGNDAWAAANCILVCPYTAISRVDGESPGQRGAVQGLRHVRRHLSVRRHRGPALYRRANRRPNRGGAGMGVEFEPRIIAFMCNWCTYTAADNAGVARMEPVAQHSAHPRDVLRAHIARDGDARLPHRRRRRAGDGLPHRRLSLLPRQSSHGQAHAALRNLLGYVGINPERLELHWVSGAEAPRYVAVTEAFIQKIRQLGPISQEVTE